MARYVFKLPDIGEGIAEAEVVNWHVKVGDTVAEDDPLVDMMTDKATVELSSPQAGRVISVGGSPGDKLRVGSELAVLDISDGNSSEIVTAKGNADADAETPAVGPDMALHGKAVDAELPEPMVSSSAASAGTKTAHAGVRPAPRQAGGGPSHHAFAAPSSAVPRVAGERPLASPAVRRRAQELGIGLQFLRGTGPAGRIVHPDLDAYLSARDPAREAGGGLPRTGLLRDGVQEVKVIGLRRRIAERMQESKRRIPHYSYVEELDATVVEELRAHLNARRDADQPRLTLLPFIIKAIVRAVSRFPQVNAIYDDEASVVRRHEAVHMGIATQTSQGLTVPVLRHAEAMDLWQTAVEILRLSEAVREGKAHRDELTGSTITVTSLGPLGGIAHTPIINHPEVAIVGVNRMVERPVVRNGQVVVRRMMNLSSSFDHRVVDGWDAASFIQEVKGLLEQPASLFIGRTV